MDNLVLTDPELALSFESLGGHGHGCEFGIFQRTLGADPLGLFRWADIPPRHLCAALETGLAGIGDPEFTVVFDPGAGHNDMWWSKDARYHMAMGTFIRLDAMSQDEAFSAVCRRQRFLCRKLLEDFAEGRKIFVYRDMFRNLDLPTRDRLLAAVRRYGSATLLIVQYEDAEHPNGTVERADDGPMLGYIDHFAFSPENKHISPATESLRRICRQAAHMQGLGHQPALAENETCFHAPALGL